MAVSSSALKLVLIQAQGRAARLSFRFFFFFFSQRDLVLLTYWVRGRHCSPTKGTPPPQTTSWLRMELNEMHLWNCNRKSEASGNSSCLITPLPLVSVSLVPDALCSVRHVLNHPAWTFLPGGWLGLFNSDSPSRVCCLPSLKWYCVDPLEHLGSGSTSPPPPGRSH